jgi:hypothetical protein
MGPKFIHSVRVPIFQWIPYDQFNNIKKIGEKNEASLAIWKIGPLHFDLHGKKEWKRESDKKVCLINYFDVIDANIDFLMKEVHV